MQASAFLQISRHASSAASSGRIMRVLMVLAEQDLASISAANLLKGMAGASGSSRLKERARPSMSRYHARPTLIPSPKLTSCFLKYSKTCVTMLQYLLHRLTVSPDYSGQRSQLHKRLFVPTKPLPARLALMHQVSTCLHCISYMVCRQQGLDTGKEDSVCYIHRVAHILRLFNHCCYLHISRRKLQHFL